MEDQTRRLAALLAQTKTAHYEAFAENDGDDPDWAIWYADYLYDRLPDYLGIRLNKSDIIYRLMYLADTQALDAPDADWAEYYANKLVKRYP